MSHFDFLWLWGFGFLCVLFGMDIADWERAGRKAIKRRALFNFLYMILIFVAGCHRIFQGIPKP